MFPQQPATHPEHYQVPQPEANQAPQPEAFPAPQAEPAAAAAAGHEAPAWGPPVVGHETPAWGPPVAGPDEVPPPPPFSGPPSSAPPFAPAPPAAPGRRAFAILVTVAAVLALAIPVTAILGWTDVSELRQGVSDRRAEQAATARQEEAAARKLLDDFRGAGLDSKLQRVKDLDRAADVAFGSWQSGTARFGVLEAAMNDCNTAVITYNTAAGPFPDHMFTSLPRQIDVKSSATDCGRAFTASI